MKHFTITLTEPQAHAVGFVLAEAIRLQKAKLQCCPDDPWRKGLCRDLDGAQVQFNIASQTEAKP